MDCNMSHHDRKDDAGVCRHFAEGGDEEDAGESGRRRVTAQVPSELGLRKERRKVKLLLKRDWQDVSLDSCGILATSPEQLLATSFEWDWQDVSLDSCGILTTSPEQLLYETLRPSLDLRLQSSQSENPASVNLSSRPTCLGGTRSESLDQQQEKRVEQEDVRTEPVVRKNDKEMCGTQESSVGESSHVPGPVRDEKEVHAVSEAEPRAPPDSEQRRRRTRRLRKASSAEDVSSDRASLADVEAEDAEGAVCLLDGAGRVSFLHKAQPHMKTSHSDNALRQQAQNRAGGVPQRGSAPPARARPAAAAPPPDSNPFARFRMKMSALSVPRTGFAAGAKINEPALSISKSHIRKSQRAMEVFEKLVRDKLKGRDCETRIIFI